MEYISQIVLEQTIEKMKEEVHHHLVFELQRFEGVEHLADEVNQIIEDTLRKVSNP